MPVFAVVATAVLSCCGPPPVGYQGPLPSVVARQSLDELWGKSLPAGSVAFTDQEVKLTAFVVGPLEPTVIVEQVPFVEDHPPAGRHWIPVFADGDIADLHQRATGSVPARLAGAGDVSDGYRRKMTGK